ncbi:MAG: CHAT domain-containing protein, partial [Flammeovirgaceae bacterium]
LAVLSACNTGFGQLQRGEGVMSIGRAFAYAGCPSIAMSHWQVDDEATAQLMEGFYQGLSDGLTKSAAMRQAQLNYLANTSPRSASPFYWGSFIVIGDNAPVVSSSSWYYWAIGVVLLAIIGWLLSRRRLA